MTTTVHFSFCIQSAPSYCQISTIGDSYKGTAERYCIYFNTLECLQYRPLTPIL